MDVTKLPKWAQSRIAELEGEKSHLLAEVGRLMSSLLDEDDRSGVSDRVFLVGGFVHDPDRPMPNGTYRFVLGCCPWSEYVQVRVTADNELDIQGGRPLAIQPAASNHLTIGISN